MKTSLTLLLSLWALTAAAESTFHGNLARTGVYAGAGPKQLGHVKWSLDTGGAIVGSPTLADGVVYITSMSGYLYAVDRLTGAEKWKFKSSQPIASSVAVDGGVAYFVSSAGALAAIDTTTGQPKWTFALEFERKFEAPNLHGYPPAKQTIADAYDLFTSSPAVAGGKVYFGSGDGNVYAVDAKTGLLQWRFATGDVVHASPAVANNTVYIGSWDGHFYAIDADSGLARWTFNAGQDPVVHNQVGFQASAAVVDGVVYVGCRDAHVYALDATTGRVKWSYTTNMSWVNTTPAVRDGLVYAGTSDSSRFFALDARSGRLRFNFDAKAYIFSSPALAGDTAYFGSHNGRLYAVDAKTGVLRSVFQTEASRQNKMNVLTPDGSFNRDAFASVFHDFEDMYLDVYRTISVGAIVSSPAVEDGVVFVGSMDGKLYALD